MPNANQVPASPPTVPILRLGEVSFSLSIVSPTAVSMVQPQSGADLERTIRLRENKRRYRTRQKDYIAGLEQRLRQARDEGIQATKEVQLCAQKVVRENERLKELLRHQGVDDNVIALWIRRDDDFINNTKVCRNECVKKTSVCKRKEQEKFAPAIVSPSDEIKQDDSNGPITNESPKLLSPARQAESSNFESMRPQFAETSSVTPLAPRKLISHLAASPSADLSQIPIPAEGTNQLDEREGVECSRAYQMLMPYGTTVAKLDNIAFTLETGCRKNYRGGCSVQKDYMYKALDELQS